MKFPQIFMLLAVFCITLFSCRENVPKEENNIPSAEEHQNRKSTPKKNSNKPGGYSRDSIIKKQRKSKDLDTLKPKIAMLR